MLTRKANELVEAKRWAEAKPVLQKLIEAYPDYVGPESAYRMLALAHQALGETNLEREVLERFAARDDEAQDAYGRLMELGVVEKDWTAVETNALRYLAVNPLVPPPYRYLAQASEQTKNSKNGIAAYRALLELDHPISPRRTFAWHSCFTMRAMLPHGGTCSRRSKKHLAIQRLFSYY